MNANVIGAGVMGQQISAMLLWLWSLVVLVLAEGLAEVAAPRGATPDR